MADPGDAASEGAASGGAGHEDGCQETADPEDLVRRADALLWASRMVWDLGGSARHLVARLAGESRAVMAYCALALAIEVFLLIAAFLPYAPPPPGVVIFGGGPMGPFLTVCYFPLFLAWQICAVGAARFIARVGQAAAAEAQVR